ncbi:MAG: glutamate--cysteine ligase, partial [Pseudomonadota bacterium]|nr:glutamate--cysteine ligase [Pseudomonadota bacterium]
QVVTIARQGLVARARRDGSGADESVYLAPLEAIAASGVTRADKLLAAFDGPWQSSVLPAYEACRY